MRSRTDIGYRLREGVEDDGKWKMENGSIGLLQ
jgi:hypothetical protein